MALLLSKKKRPKKEEKQIKKENKIEGEVFDRNTLICLSSLIGRGVIESVEGVICRGKEANIFLAKKGEEFFAVKIFRIETRTFWRLLPYVNGDPRFEGALKKRRALAFVLARKEFSNLKVAWEANVRCPKPIKFLRNILISTFLGENGIRYPRLAEAGSENPETDLNRILEEIKRLYSAGLVHSDISEYNVVMCSDGPYLIDFAQAVSIKHPRANEFLERDVSNIIRYFEKKYGIRRNKEAEIAKIISV